MRPQQFNRAKVHPARSVSKFSPVENGTWQEGANKKKLHHDKLKSHSMKWKRQNGFGIRCSLVQIIHTHTPHRRSMQMVRGVQKHTARMGCASKGYDREAVTPTLTTPWWTPNKKCHLSTPAGIGKIKRSITHPKALAIRVMMIGKCQHGSR